MEQKYPAWVLTLVKLIRPFALLSLILILVLGSIWFSIASFFYPEAGKASMETFTGFFSAMDEDFYTTVQLMFITYVAGRSTQAIAKDYLNAKLVGKDEGPNPIYRHDDYYMNAGWDRPPPPRYDYRYASERPFNDERGGYG